MGIRILAMSGNFTGQLLLLQGQQREHSRIGFHFRGHLGPAVQLISL